MPGCVKKYKQKNQSFLHVSCTEKLSELRYVCYYSFELQYTQQNIQVLK